MVLFFLSWVFYLVMENRHILLMMLIMYIDKVWILWDILVSRYSMLFNEGCNMWSKDCLPCRNTWYHALFLVKFILPIFLYCLFACLWLSLFFFICFIFAIPLSVYFRLTSVNVHVVSFACLFSDSFKTLFVLIRKTLHILIFLDQTSIAIKARSDSQQLMLTYGSMDRRMLWVWGETVLFA